MTLGYAPNVKGIKGLVADFNSSFRGIIKRSGIDLHLRKSGIEVNNYFGAGNNSFYNESLFKSKYYRVENEKYTAELGITFPADRKLRFNFGLQFTHFRVEEKDNSISNIILFTPEGKHKVNLGYIKCGIELDGRDHITAPFKGYYLNVSGNYSPKLFNSNYEFGRITGDLRGYIGYKTAISLALRAWGEKVIGKSFPFFESAFLGGVKYLHGFPSERFAGDASLLGTAEIRLKLFTYNLLLPQTIGIFGFGETGRVFLKNEASEKWHASYGGGLFMHLINRDFTFKLTFARSDEKDLLFYFGTGFGF
jgi:outer membrane protein assembly factor BamA